MGDIGSTIALAVVATLWTAYSNVASSHKQLNEVRNTILIGKIGNDEISTQLRKHILINDWLPGWIATTLINFAFSLTIFLAPQFLGPNSKQVNSIRAVCYCVGTFPSLATLMMMICGYFNYKYMREELKRATNAKYVPRLNPEERLIVQGKAGGLDKQGKADE